MPIGGNNTEPHKKRSNKKRTLKQTSKSKRRITEKNEAKNSKKMLVMNVLSDATLENDRIEQYKELRRQRYSEARQQAIETIVEKMKKTTYYPREINDDLTR
ncbi:unnamed protein product [Rotaria sp. Silwood2]|nr:unnamed protein product [Rotaria sp. Silwood2]CAF2583991.1 unnamed protein product [Rotaria sp. Silwood2]CAF4580066.1 unnamed protein product [Rotaria sp. Silwood2]